MNFGTDNITAAFLEARAIKDAFQSPEITGKGITLEAVEIGNEPDLYGNNGHRNSGSWNIQEYVNECVDVVFGMLRTLTNGWYLADGRSSPRT